MKIFTPFAQKKGCYIQTYEFQQYCRTQKVLVVHQIQYTSNNDPRLLYKTKFHYCGHTSVTNEAPENTNTAQNDH